MRKSSYYVKQLKWTTMCMAEHSFPAAASAIMKSGAGAEMQKLKTDTLEEVILQKVNFVGSEKEWGSRIFENQCFA